MLLLLAAASLVAILALFLVPRFWRMSAFLVTSAVLVLDQTTKTAVVQHMAKYESIPVVGDWLKLTFTTNPGMAFGMELGPPGTVTLFAILATVLIVVYMRHIRTTFAPYRYSLALILGGALGNIIDRVFYGVLYGADLGLVPRLFRGEVVDFVHVDLGEKTLPLIGTVHLFPIWNVADMAIVLGVIGFVLFQKQFQQSLPPDPADAPEGAANDLPSATDDAAPAYAADRAGRPEAPPEAHAAHVGAPSVPAASVTTTDAPLPRT